MTKLIDGNQLGKQMDKRTKLSACSFSEDREINFRPRLIMVLVGKDKASLLYLQNKKRKARQLGIPSQSMILKSDITQEHLDFLLDSLSANPIINAILVQLPLPEHLDEHETAKHIAPMKDVDGMNPINIGKLATNVDRQKHFYPVSCTGQGIMTMLNSVQKPFDFRDKKVVIVVRSNIVGRPLNLMLINAGADVEILNHYTSPELLSNECRSADIIISATGQTHLINSTTVVKYKQPILIDAGISHNKVGALTGDISYQAQMRSRAYTHVHEGVGVMTIASLMKQTVQLAKYQYNRTHE